MTELELQACIKVTSAGEQDRYGQVQYQLNTNERIANLAAIAQTLGEQTGLDTKDIPGLASLLFWGLCDEGMIVDACIKFFVPLAHQTAVAAGFMEGLSPSLTLDFRQRHVMGIYRRLEPLHLTAVSQSWASLCLTTIEGWSREDQSNPVTQALVADLQKLTKIGPAHEA